MGKNKDYRVRLGKLARELATDQHGRLKGWNLERAIEALQNKPTEDGGDQISLLKEQLFDIHLQLRSTNAMISILISELDGDAGAIIHKIDELSAKLQAEAAQRAGLKFQELIEVRDKVWYEYDISYWKKG
jgi:predicted  nucleic acid-binding Zn-ribbon protein